jgi:hypothetical protein
MHSVDVERRTSSIRWPTIEASLVHFGSGLRRYVRANEGAFTLS